MTEIIFNGLLITGNYNYIKFTLAPVYELKIDTLSKTLEICFPSGMRSSDPLTDNDFTVINDQELIESDWIRYKEVHVKMNNFVFKKLTSDLHTFHQVIVRNLVESCIISTPTKTVFYLHPDIEVSQYLTLWAQVKYLKVITPDVTTFNNFYTIPIADHSLNLTSTNEKEFSSRIFYERYKIKQVDVLYQFKKLITEILEDYDLPVLVESTSENPEKSSYIHYKVGESSKKKIHTSGWGDLRDAVEKRAKYLFSVRTPNLIQYFDFINRYENLDLLSNFRNFQTDDSYGEPWECSVQWSELTTDFDHDIAATDERNNASFNISFEAEIDFFEVYDKVYGIIETILLDLNEDQIIITGTEETEEI